MRWENFKAFDNSTIRLYFRDHVTAPRAVLQIAHGMAEHAARYEAFAEFLNENGIIVVADDHRAFGYTAGPEDNGVYDGDCFGDTLRDLSDIHQLCRTRWPGIPIFFLGHSYGSFLAQAFVQENGKTLAGAVIMGSNYMNNPLFSVLRGLLRPFRCALGYDRPAILLDKLIFGRYDRMFPEGQKAWLSRDAEEVRLYREDPLCGKVCSLGFYESFLGFRRLYRPEKLKQIPPDLPILITSGAADPVGDMGKGPRRLAAFYRDLGLRRVSLKLYEGARHEILNEINRDEVYDDLLNFMLEAIRKE